MATLIIKDHDYHNWVKGGLVLKFSKDGIENFVETNIDKFHKNVLKCLPVGPHCNICSTENIIQCKNKPNNNFCKFSKNNCTVHDPKDPSKKSRPCPSAVCNVVRDKILTNHRFNGPSWKNTDSSRWCREPWQLATCYMSAGYKAATSASGTDFPGLLNVVINNTIFDTEVTDDLSNKKNLFCLARDARNSILHKADMRLSDAELAAHITTLDNMLADAQCLARHPSAIQARLLLQQLLNGTIRVTTRDEEEVLAEALKSIDDKKVEAIVAVKIEKDEIQVVIGSKKVEAIAAVNKEKDKAQVVIESKKDEAVAAVNKEKDKAQVVIKSKKDEAIAAVNKEKDKAQVVIESKKDEAVAAVNKEKDEIQVVIGSKKVEAVAAVNKEKDEAQVIIESKKDEAVAAVNKEKDKAQVVIESKKVEAVAAVNKEKDKAQVVIESKKDETVAAVNKEKDKAKVAIKLEKVEAVAAVNKEKDKAQVVIDSKKDEAVAAVNKVKDKAQVVIESEKIAALAALYEEKDNVKEEIISRKKEAFTSIDNKVAYLQKALHEAHNVFKEKEAVANLQRISTDSYDKIKQDLKAELLSVYQDGAHLYTPLSPLDSTDDKHIEQLYAHPDMELADHQNVETYKDIFKEGKQKIYVVGEAGTGKTALCQKMVSTWCQVQTGHIEQMSDDQQALAQYDFLFYISLRDETARSCVDEMIKHSLLPNKASLHESLSKMLEEERCLVILDGLDEWTTENKTASPSHINKGIPGRDSIRNCTVINTTRPWKLEVLQLKSSQIDAKIELLGICKVSYEQLAQSIIIHLNIIRQRKKMYKDFISEIEEKQLIHFLTIPVNLKQLVYLWHLGKTLGTTKCAMYSQMLELLLELALNRLKTDSHFQKKKDEWMKSTIKLPSCFDKSETCQEFKPLLLALAKLAFLTLFSADQQLSLVFKSTKAGCYHLSQAEVNICLKIGILSQNKILREFAFPFRKLSFLHKTYQEFLAAVFVSLDQSNAKQCVKQIQNICNNEVVCGEMTNVLTFISGVCTSDLTCELLKHFNKHLTSIMDRQPMILECIREGYRCSHRSGIFGHRDKHLHIDHIDIREPSQYLDQLCKVNIPNIKRLDIYSSPTAQCLQYLLQTHTLKVLYIVPQSDLPISEDHLYDLIHHNRHTLRKIWIYSMTLRSNTRLSTLIPQVQHLWWLYIVNTTLPQQLLTSLQALHSDRPYRHVYIHKPTILPDTESTD